MHVAFRPGKSSQRRFKKTNALREVQRSRSTPEKRGLPRGFDERIGPCLKVEPRENVKIRFRNRTHVAGLRFDEMNIELRRSDRFDLDPVSADLPDEIGE
ncbi:MAG: hypothetical protein A3J70_08935 [Elusimicrobia bacterium RIFCSPHIGHO2_02_FULL_61_10]|nr:MAG: hypothetical protein A3J70_08935 [Elusimicrobia bacterium RIFCSPHIGHO2_02_FULL_61_10]